MEAWMRKLGLVMDLKTLGVTEDMVEALADSTVINEGGYKILTRDEIIKIFKESI